MEGIGYILKDKRESLGLSIEDVSVQTKLKPYIIENIESNNFDEIGDVGFVKIMVITYGRALSINDEIIQSKLIQLFDKPIDPPIKINTVKNTKPVVVSPNIIYFLLLGFLIIFLTVSLVHLYQSEALSFNAIREQLVVTERRIRTTNQPSEVGPDSLFVFQRNIFNESNNITEEIDRPDVRMTRLDTVPRNNKVVSNNQRTFNTSTHFIEDSYDYVGEMIFNNVTSPLNPDL